MLCPPGVSGAVMVPVEIREARVRLAEASSEDAASYLQVWRRASDALAREKEEAVLDLIRLINIFTGSLILQLGAFGLDPADPVRSTSVPLIAREIRSALARLNVQASKRILESITVGAEGGGGVLAGALRAVQIPMAAPPVTPELIASLARSTSVTFSEILSDLGDRMINQVRTASVGTISPGQAVRNIERMLSTSEEVRQGLRRRIGFGFQAEAIVRTEVGTAYSMAQQLASEQISGSIPDLRKRWVTALAERRGHREAEDRYAIGGSVGPIPVREKFIVRDFSRIGRSTFMTVGRGGGRAGRRVIRTKPFTRRGRIITDRMLHPRDLSASAGNRINCTCLVLEVIPELEMASQRVSGIL